MKNSRLTYLFQLYIEKKASPEEKEELMRLLADENNEVQVKSLFEEAWDRFEPNQPVFTSMQSKAILSKALRPGINSNDSLRRKITLWPRIGLVAAILIFSAVGLYFWQAGNRAETPEIQLSEQKHDILPGDDRAVLTLADGSKIILDDAENGAVSRQGNTQVIKTGNLVAYNSQSLSKGKIFYNTITTPRGGQYQIILPDGTHVWLNAASSLRFPTAFSGKERLVELSGEGYFEAARNAKKPFKVKLRNDAVVEVLGTHFNIVAYDDEKSINTTLLEGSVRMHKGGTSKVLIPGQQAQISEKSDEINILPVDTLEAAAWKNGFFQFSGADIQTIMRQLSRWYNVDVVFAGDIPQGHYRGKVSRTANISQVLKILELSGINFTIKEGRKIIVNP